MQSVIKTIKALGLHKGLVFEYSRRIIQQRFRGSIFGISWLIISPFILTSIYIIVFAVVLPNPFTGVNHSLHIASLVLSISLFNMVLESVHASPAYISRNPNYVKKVVFPLEVLCIAEIPLRVMEFACAILLLICYLAFTGTPMSWHGLWIVFFVIIGVIMSIGAALILASVGVFLRDLEHVIQHVSRILMYTSAVFYPPERIPPTIWNVLKWNPILHLIDQARKTLLYAQPPDLMIVGILFFLALAIFAIGSTLLNRLRPSFSDLL